MKMKKKILATLLFGVVFGINDLNCSMDHRLGMNDNPPYAVPQMPKKREMPKKRGRRVTIDMEKKIPIKPKGILATAMGIAQEKTKERRKDILREMRKKLLKEKGAGADATSTQPTADFGNISSGNMQNGSELLSVPGERVGGSGIDLPPVPTAVSGKQPLTEDDRNWMDCESEDMSDTLEIGRELTDSVENENPQHLLPAVNENPQHLLPAVNENPLPSESVVNHDSGIWQGVYNGLSGAYNNVISGVQDIFDPSFWSAGEILRDSIRFLRGRFVARVYIKGCGWVIKKMFNM